MPNLFIEKDVLDRIKTILFEVLPVGTKAYLFGSRANGTADTFSDVDIALRNGDGLVDGTIMSALLVNFEAAALPYKVDLVDLNAIPDEFRRAIEDDLLQLHRVLSRAPQTRMPI